MVLQRGFEPRRSLALRALLRSFFRFAQKRFAFGVRGFESHLQSKKDRQTVVDGLPVFGAPAGIRTPDTLLKRQVLCLLSYWGIAFVMRDLFCRLPKSEPSGAGPIWKGRGRENSAVFAAWRKRSGSSFL